MGRVSPVDVRYGLAQRFYIYLLGTIGQVELSSLIVLVHLSNESNVSTKCPIRIGRA